MHGAGGGLLYVFIGFVDIAQLNQLLQGLVLINRITLGAGRMEAGVAFDGIPAGHAGDGGRFAEGAKQGLAIHVVADRQAEQAEDGGGDV